MNEQMLVKEFVESYALECNLQSRMLDLVSEVGELSKEVLKGTSYGKNDFCITPNFEMELGDVFFSLCCIASQTNSDLSEALSKALLKYESRMKTKKSIGSEY